MSTEKTLAKIVKGLESHGFWASWRADKKAPDQTWSLMFYGRRAERFDVQWGTTIAVNLHEKGAIVTRQSYRYKRTKRGYKRVDSIDTQIQCVLSWKAIHAAIMSVYPARREKPWWQQPKQQ